MSGRTFTYQSNYDDFIRYLLPDVEMSDRRKSVGIGDSMLREIEEFINRFAVTAVNDNGDLSFDAAGTYTFNGDVVIAGGGELRSSNYVYETSGWRLVATGSTEFNGQMEVGGPILIDPSAYIASKNYSAATAGFKIDGNTGVGDFASGLIVNGDFTADTTTLVVDSTNNRVGVGTATPIAGVHIEGYGDVSNTSTGHYFQLGATSGANMRIDTNEINAVNNGSSGTLYLQNDGGTLRVGNNSTTNMTVSGVFTPGEIDAFDNVTSPTSSTAKFLFGRSSSQAMALHGSSSGNQITSISQTSNPKNLRLAVSKDDGASSYHYTFSDTGLNIGSGSGPGGTEALAVQGTALVTSAFYPNNGSQVMRNWSSGSDIDALLPGSSFGGVIDGNTSGHIVVGIRNNDTADSFSIVSGGTNSGGYTANNTYDLLVANFRADGNVGIGTNSPTDKLDVNGNLRVRTGVDGGMEIRPWTANSAYSSIANTNHTGLEYTLLASANATFISCGSGGSVNLRPSANTVSGISVQTTGTFIISAFPGVSGYLTVRRRSSDGLLGYASSSQRYKENIADADDTWRQIYDLRPRDFDWRESMFDTDPDGVPDDRSDYGLIAEEAHLVMPSIVDWAVPNVETEVDEDNNPIPPETPPDPIIESVDYEKLSRYFLPAIQDLNNRVIALEA